jgi:heat shock transcription factor, other eukaryote
LCRLVAELAVRIYISSLGFIYSIHGQLTMDYLQNELWRFQQQQTGTEMQIGDIERRIHDMEQRQLKMISFLQKAQSNPRFMKNLITIADGFQRHTALSVPSPGLPGLLDPPPVTDSLHKKRRLPTEEEMQYSPELMESCTNNNVTSNNNGSLYEDPCSSSGSGRTDFSLNNQSFDKLKLGLCPAMAAMSTHSSNEEEDNGPLARIPDTGTSLFTLKSTLLSGDGPSPSNLDLTLASFPSMEMVRGRESNTTNMSAVYLRGEDTNGTNENGIVTRSENKSRTEDGTGTGSENRSGTENGNRNENNVGSQNGSGGLQKDAGEREEQVGPTTRINDVFWEQFLTERP